jgi:hypothetical protein
MSRARPAPVVTSLLLVLGVSAPAAAQPAACGSFRVEWNRGELSPTSSRLEGIVYNESRCSVTDVRLHVLAVDSEGRPVAETSGWVYGDIPAGGRGYFAAPLRTVPAADYRVSVISFDAVSEGAR